MTSEVLSHIGHHLTFHEKKTKLARKEGFSDRNTSAAPKRVEIGSFLDAFPIPKLNARNIYAPISF